MMMMIMNCFCGMVDERIAFSLFLAGTIVRDSHLCKSPTRCKQDLYPDFSNSLGTSRKVQKIGGSKKRSFRRKRE